MCESRRGFSRIETGPLPREKDCFAYVDWPDGNGPKTALGMARCALAQIDDSTLRSLAGDRTAIILGTVWGDTQLLEEQYDAIMVASPEPTARTRIKAAFLHYPIGSIAEALADEIGATGPILTVCNACASGNVALGVGHDLIEAGEVDHAVCLGVDRFSLTGLWGAERSGFVGRTARPFDKNRTGAVLGEGAGVLVLSRPEKSDGASILGWLEGWDVYCEPGAAAITLWDDGLGLKRAMRNACAMADPGKDSIQILTQGCG